MYGAAGLGAVGLVKGISDDNAINGTISGAGLGAVAGAGAGAVAASIAKGLRV